MDSERWKHSDHYLVKVTARQCIATTNIFKTKRYQRVNAEKFQLQETKQEYGAHLNNKLSSEPKNNDNTLRGTITED